jgi:hypothetical protein
MDDDERDNRHPQRVDKVQSHLAIGADQARRQNDHPNSPSTEKAGLFILHKVARCLDPNQGPRTFALRLPISLLLVISRPATHSERPLLWEAS